MNHYYVKRSKDGRVEWSGPFDGGVRALQEEQAWKSVGWLAKSVMSTQGVRAEVDAWVKSVKPVAHDAYLEMLAGHVASRPDIDRRKD